MQGEWYEVENGYPILGDWGRDWTPTGWRYPWLWMAKFALGWSYTTQRIIRVSSRGREVVDG